MWVCVLSGVLYPTLEQLSASGKEVFADVVEDFHKLSLIKQRFEEWKFGFPESYQQAYISLCIPKLFAPLVRLQLLDWNPLEVSLASETRWVCASELIGEGICGWIFVINIHTLIPPTHTHTSPIARTLKR